MNYLILYCLNFHLGVTRNRSAPHLSYIGNQRKSRKPLPLIFYMEKNNLIVKACLLNSLFLQFIFQTTFQCVSICNGFYLLVNVTVFIRVCYFTCVIMFYLGVMYGLLAMIYTRSALFYHIIHFSFRLEKILLMPAC